MPLNIVVIYGWSLYALVRGLFISRWVVATVGKSDVGLYNEVVARRRIAAEETSLLWGP